MTKSLAIADRVIERSLAKDALLITGAVAIIALAAQISIPLWPVPITLSTFAVMVLAATLGSARGSLSIVGYLTAGSIGLPVFANAATLSAVRPTFGYLLGFLAAAMIIGHFASRGADRSPLRMAAVLSVASLVIYVFGAGWLIIGFGMTATQALMAGVIPFLLGDALKVVAATALITGIRKLVS